MKDLLVNGARILTTDDIVDAVLEYALELADKGRHAVAAFPAIVDGQVAETTMFLGAGIPLVAVVADSELPITLPGADLAVWEIRRRTAMSAGTGPGTQWNVPD